jgi:hypothetical protein
MKEANVQKHLVSYLYATLPSDALIIHIPNGLGKISMRAGVQAKAMGLMAGVADLMVLLPGPKCIFIEVKNEKGRQSPAQKAFEANATALGFVYIVARSIDDVRMGLAACGVKTRESNNESF